MEEAWKISSPIIFLSIGLVVAEYTHFCDMKQNRIDSVLEQPCEPHFTSKALLASLVLFGILFGCIVKILD